MATRFLAVVSHESDTAAGLVDRLRKSTGFALAIDHPALAVLVEDSGGVVSSGRADCAVLGWLFDRDDFRRCQRLDGKTVGALQESDFAPLLRDYWGGYVAIAIDRETSAITVLRDPSGGLPCYYRRTTEATFLFSDLATWRAAGMERLALDWTGVAWRLSTANFPSSRTAFDQIDELCAGFRLRASDRHAVAEAAWSPWDHVHPPYRSIADTRAVLRDTVLRCIAAWAAPFDSVLLNLSGGLDSSIIAAGLAGRAGRDAAITMATRSASGDERPYARSVAEATGLALAECFYEPDDVDMTCPSLPALPRPGGRAIGQAFEAARQRVGARHGSDAFFTGLGGDNVFCFLQSPTPIADRLKAQGPSLALRETIDSVCLQTGCSVATALVWAVQRAWALGARRDCVAALYRRVRPDECRAVLGRQRDVRHRRRSPLARCDHGGDRCRLGTNPEYARDLGLCRADRFAGRGQHLQADGKHRILIGNPRAYWRGRQTR